MVETEYLIIGAGISGLVAADVLRAAGSEVLMLDKGRGVGGRMATRRIGDGRADHGAQFFTVRSTQFQTLVNQWLAENLIFEWSTGWAHAPQQAAKLDGHPRYAGINGMTTVPKAIASRHQVITNCRVGKVTAVDNQWQVEAEDKTRYKAQALLLTPPVPQSLTLLENGNTRLGSEDETALKKISYAPCVAGLFWVEGAVELPAPGALQRPDHTFSWIANNQQKGISPQAQLITVHANPDQSWQIWEASKEAQAEVLLAGLRPFMAASAQVKSAQTHRWRFAQPTILHPERSLVAKNLPPLAFAGDGFQEARIEGAVLSGLTAAAELQSRINRSTD